MQPLAVLGSNTMLGSQTPFRPYWIIIVTLLGLDVNLILHRGSFVNVAARSVWAMFSIFQGNLIFQPITDLELVIVSIRCEATTLLSVIKSFLGRFYYQYSRMAL